MSGNCFAGLRAEVRLAGAFFLAAVVTRVVCFNGGFVVAAVFALGFAVRDFVLVSGFFFAAAGTAAGFTAFFTAGFLGIAFRVVFVALGLAIGLGAFLATTAFAFGFAATGLIFDVGIFFSAAGTVAAFTVCFLAGNFFGSALAAGFLMPFLAEGLAVGFPTFLLAAATLGFSTFLADVLFGAAGFVVTEVVRFFPADFFVAGCFMAGFEALATGFVLEAVFFF